MDKRKIKEAKDAKLKAAGADKKKDRVRCGGVAGGTSDARTADWEVASSAVLARFSLYIYIYLTRPLPIPQAAGDKEKVAAGASLSLSDLRGGKGGKKGGGGGGSAGDGKAAKAAARAPPPPKTKASDTYLGDLDLPSSDSETDASGDESRAFTRDEKADVSLVSFSRQRIAARTHAGTPARPLPRPPLHVPSLTRSVAQPTNKQTIKQKTGNRAGRQAHRRAGAQICGTGGPRERGRPGRRRQRVRRVL
jgi:hypothetical protein